MRESELGGRSMRLFLTLPSSHWYISGIVLRILPSSARRGFAVEDERGGPASASRAIASDSREKPATLDTNLQAGSAWILTRLPALKGP